MYGSRLSSSTRELTPRLSRIRLSVSADADPSDSRLLDAADLAALAIEPLPHTFWVHEYIEQVEVAK
jgi:hypothetical protein